MQMGLVGRQWEALWVKVLSARYGVEEMNGWFLGGNVEKWGSTRIKAWWKLAKVKAQ